MSAAAEIQSVRLDVLLGAPVAAALCAVADRHEISVTEALRRAISLQSFVEDAAARGAAVHIEERGKRLEVQFVPRPRTEAAA